MDGNRVLLMRRDGPDEALVRGLWQLLPDRSRVDLWPASFAFSDELGFHFAVVATPTAAPRAGDSDRGRGTRLPAEPIRIAPANRDRNRRPRGTAQASSPAALPTTRSGWSST